MKMLPVLRRSLLNFSNFKSSRPVSIRHYWQRNAFNELSAAMQSIENNMRQMDRLFDGFQRSSPVRFPRIFFPFESSRTREVPTISTDGDGRTFRLDLDVEGMKPEDINVTLKDHELTITAKREEKRSDGSIFARENRYHYTLPADVNLDSIRSSLTDGVLTIEAPLPALESKEIPVKIESGSKLDKSDSTKQA